MTYRTLAKLGNTGDADTKRILGVPFSLFRVWGSFLPHKFPGSNLPTRTGRREWGSVPPGESGGNEATEPRKRPGSPNILPRLPCEAPLSWLKLQASLRLPLQPSSAGSEADSELVLFVESS